MLHLYLYTIQNHVHRTSICPSARASYWYFTMYYNKAGGGVYGLTPPPHVLRISSSPMAHLPWVSTFSLKHFPSYRSNRAHSPAGPLGHSIKLCRCIFCYLFYVVKNNFLFVTKIGVSQKLNIHLFIPEKRVTFWSSQYVMWI